MRAKQCVLIMGILALRANFAWASAMCGDPPPVANDQLKGEIVGKAKVLSQYLANAELAGKIETSRTEIFSKYPDAELSRSNAYFEYQVCVLLMSDSTLSSSEKLNRLKEVRREFGKPVVKKHAVIIQSGKKFIDNTEFGSVNGRRSSMNWMVDGETITDGDKKLNVSFGSHTLELTEGDHTFEVAAAIFSADEPRVLRDNCSGTFRVSGPGIYEPFVALEPRAERSGAITKCSLSRR